MLWNALAARSLSLQQDQAAVRFLSRVRLDGNGSQTTAEKGNGTSICTNLTENSQ